MFSVTSLCISDEHLGHFWIYVFRLPDNSKIASIVCLEELVHFFRNWSVMNIDSQALFQPDSFILFKKFGIKKVFFIRDHARRKDADLVVAAHADVVSPVVVVVR